MNATSNNTTNSTNPQPDMATQASATEVASAVSTKKNTTSETSAMLERRQGYDRRRWTCHHDFPYVDSHGYLVEQNRRNSTDRRRSTQKRRQGR